MAGRISFSFNNLYILDTVEFLNRSVLVSVALYLYFGLNFSVCICIFLQIRSRNFVSPTNFNGWPTIIIPELN